MDPAQLHRILRQHVQTDRLLGVDQVPCAAPSALAEPDSKVRFALRRSPERLAPPPAAVPNLLIKPEPMRPVAGSKAEAIERIRERLLADTQLLEWQHPGGQLVLGEGSPEAELMFIGEGAGEQEAQQGRPFVGPAGQLLDKMIVAMGMQRSEVYITNVVHFRPPNNRAPTPQELDHCRGYWLEQVLIVQPKVIVALGGSAAKALLDTKEGITRLRGRWQQLTQVDPPIPLMPTFHPAFLLRSYTKDNRQKVWSDLQTVMERLKRQ